ncbi:sulfur oxidation c-type cytochrome SoxX [Ramlibacter sp. USB13]|uniref:Sulfur oxidation c-type cytochrome SoxX n=1 Tax=Ramlibacter cellulosilyticus TaxID=2764187 RepID=A0A923MTF3_9BURK|nr:sulfur oxidation c-type cytochrome SoxX [Ramlibacter cellulosilyticus]MBC5783844.1 sulfur oxidation c-type cytochrome SoxX [Ramlibacter cellulosilyticus]
MKKTLWTLGALALAAAVVGCNSLPMGGIDADKLTQEMVRTGFRSEGIAKVERVTQTDETLQLCSAADAAGKPLAPEVAKRIEEANLKTIKWPSDGKFLGDWKQGEQIAQSGRGQTWTDGANAANGGNCYNCHQISKEEISFGTIGPSLYHYGKLRGVSDPNSAAAKPIVEYTWGKIWNAKAYNACSNMPRSGHMGNLTETQVRHIMALLLDPASPVNK